MKVFIDRSEVHFHFHGIAEASLNSLKELIMATKEEVTAELVTLKATLERSNAEIAAKLATLAQAIADAGNSTPAMDAALADLQTAVGVTDSFADPLPETPPAP